MMVAALQMRQDENALNTGNTDKRGQEVEEGMSHASISRVPCTTELIGSSPRGLADTGTDDADGVGGLAKSKAEGLRGRENLTCCQC